ncbi:hypothetical protein CFF27374_05125 [Campylobacter fetus subsp. fetus]|nr:hypothetical protein CFF27374_05125 [Campylobacter fetus subsp. fetus]
MNTSKEHFSPTNSDIIPQNTKRDGKYPSSQVKAKPIKEFGTNYAEFYHDGSNAIKKLLVEKQGQVAGAFQRKELGDIDLVWGEVDKKLNGYGLAKIEAKHLNDFANFNGANPTEKMINGISEIIEKGKVVSKNGVDTIIYKTNNRIYAVGLSKGWMGKGDNSWIITSYEKKNLKETVVGDSKAISANAKFNEIKSPISTNNDIIPQNSKFDNTPTFLSKYLNL